MFSAVRKSLPRGLGLRFSLWYAGIFIVSSAACFAIAYYFVATSLRKADRNLLESKTTELQALLDAKGPGEWKNALHSFVSGTNQKFLVRITGPQGQNVFQYTPGSLREFDAALNRGLGPASDPKPRWSRFTLPREGEVLNVISVKLPSRLSLHVGHSSDDTDDIIEDFGHASLWAVGVLLVIGLVGATLFTRRALFPVRQLIEAVSTVKAGDISARVKTSGSGDELDTLRRIFNEMLEQIEGLIQGMKSTTDSLAHDLRTPITRLRTNAEIALLPNTTEEEKMEALASTVENADALIALTNTLMDVAEAESGALRLQRERLGLREVINDVADLYAYPAEQKNITLEVGSDEGIVEADPVRIKQAVANLVDNAVKYTPVGGRVRLSVERRESGVAFCVSDSGPGIPPSDLSHIWKRLYRGDASRSERGMGLGLSLVKAIAEVHGGEVGVDSLVGRGSTFRLWLPITVSRRHGEKA